MNWLSLLLLLYLSISSAAVQQTQNVSPENRDPIFQRCQKIIFNDDLRHIEAGKPDSNWETIQGNQIVKAIEKEQELSFEGDSFALLKPKFLKGNYLTNE